MSHPEQFKRVQTEAYNLFCKKNKDYGDALLLHGIVGVLVRLGDKIQQARSISNSGIVVVQNESFRDALIDLHNYAAMGVTLLDKTQLSKEAEIGKDDETDSDDSDTETVVAQREINSANPRTRGVKYTVTRYASGKVACTCPWYQHHHGEECKHIKKAVRDGLESN